MISMSRSSIVLAALVAISLLGTAARADLIVSVQEDSGAIQTFVDVSGPPSQAGGNVAGATTVTTTDYKITFLGGQAEQYSAVNNAVPPGSEVLSSTTSVANTTGNAGHVLHITITGTGFTAPTAPPSIPASSSIGGSVTASASSTNTLTFTSSIPTALPSPVFTPQTPSIATANSSYNDTQHQTITSLSSPFSIVETLTIGLDGLGNTINYSSNTNLIPVPEPSTLAIAGLGGLGLVGYGLRRRKTKA